MSLGFIFVHYPIRSLCPFFFQVVMMSLSDFSLLFITWKTDFEWLILSMFRSCLLTVFCLIEGNFPFILCVLLPLLQAGSVEGQVIDMGLTTTSLLTAEKFPVIVPNSLFSSQVGIIFLAFQSLNFGLLFLSPLWSSSLCVCVCIFWFHFLGGRGSGGLGFVGDHFCGYNSK